MMEDVSRFKRANLAEILRLWPEAANRLRDYRQAGNIPAFNVENPVALCDGKLLWAFDYRKEVHAELYCLDCGGRMNGVMHRFFRHKSAEMCKGGFFAERLPHLMAKEVIRNSRTIRIPELKETGRYHPGVEELALRAGQLPYDRVEIENGMRSKDGLFRPDAVIWSGDQEILIEIVVTHDIAVKTRGMMSAEGKTVLRIDLTGITQSGRRTKSKKELDTLVSLGVIDEQQNTRLWGNAFEAYVLSRAHRDWPIHNILQARRAVSRKEIEIEADLTSKSYERLRRAYDDLEAFTSKLNSDIEEIRSASAGWPRGHIDGLFSTSSEVSGSDPFAPKPLSPEIFRSLRNADDYLLSLGSNRSPEDRIRCIQNDMDGVMGWLRLRRENLDSLVASPLQDLDAIHQRRKTIEGAITGVLHQERGLAEKIRANGIYIVILWEITALSGDEFRAPDAPKNNAQAPSGLRQQSSARNWSGLRRLFKFGEGR